ncbi:MAG: enoyl-CoA hydratase-related protein [Pseudomonadota bacterium]|nr:enoyl-CoA hydratase-related protein [Pseudomonadota bacterium]
MSELPWTSVLRLDRRGFALFATIDDPASRNAMSDRLIADFEAVLGAIAGDRSTRALVIKGQDGVFCAGADLKNTGGDVRVANVRGGKMFARINTQPQTVIAVVNGPALGGGFGLACCADVVLAGPRARFALTETTIGLIPAQIAPYVVARIGLAATRRLALTAERLDARGAVEMGVADQAHSNEGELNRAVEAVLAGVARCAPGASEATKRLLLSLAPVKDAFRSGAAQLFADSLEGPEGREGLAAFAEKRSPSWIPDS